MVSSKHAIAAVLLLVCAVDAAHAWGIPRALLQAVGDKFIFSNKFVFNVLTNLDPKAPPTKLPDPTPGGRNGAVLITDVGCLNSVAPAPLNWRMWCAPDNATVRDWVDEAGAQHRIVTLNPQPGLRGEMISWYQSGLPPQYINYMGKRWYWYHLWHPIDHVESRNDLSNIMNPKVLIHENYRLLPNTAQNVSYSTDMWFDVFDFQKNSRLNRIQIGLVWKNTRIWTLTVSYNDTPKGCIVTAEFIVGTPARGWDPVDPQSGLPAAQAREFNSRVIGPLLAPYIDSPIYKESFAATTRHTIEEFSNLGRFLPQIFNDRSINPLGRLPGVLTQALPTLPIGGGGSGGGSGGLFGLPIGRRMVRRQ